MRTFRARRGWNIAVTALAGVALIIALLSYQVVHANTSFVSGWILLSMMLLLTLYNVRKKLTYPPLFKSSSWLQLHIYVGFLSLLVFFLHTQWRLPNGAFESIFYVFFIGLAGSGVLGIYLTRTMPKHLAGHGGEVIFERVPLFVRQLREQAEALVIESVQVNNSTIVADFYSTRLADYMAAPRPIGLHVFVTDRLREGLQGELAALHRYLNDDERAVAEKLSDVLALKDDLDYHWGKQGVLKAWLFLHIPLTYATLLFVLVHLVLVYGFSTGLS